MPVVNPGLAPAAEQVFELTARPFLDGFEYRWKVSLHSICRKLAALLKRLQCNAERFSMRVKAAVGCCFQERQVTGVAHEPELPVIPLQPGARICKLLEQFNDLTVREKQGFRGGGRGLGELSDIVALQCLVEVRAQPVMVLHDCKGGASDFA